MECERRPAFEAEDVRGCDQQRKGGDELIRCAEGRPEHLAAVAEVRK